MFDKDTEEPWDGVFNLIAEEVSKVKNRSDPIKHKKKRLIKIFYVLKI